MKYIVTLNGKRYEVEVNQTEAVLINTQPAAAAPQPTSPPQAQVPAPAVSAQAAAIAPQAASSPQAQVVAPMPGTILSVNVAVGDAVKAGQTLVVLEAMKMENEIVASQDGVVKQILTQKGTSVNTDDVLLVI